MVGRCPLCNRRYKRSSEANRRYWALLHAMSDELRPRGRQFSPDTWHVWAKSRFLGCTDYALPNGKTLTIPNSTAELDTADFHDYMTQVEAFANGLGVFLDDGPEDA